MNKKIYAFIGLLLVLTSCGNNNKEIYSQDLKKLMDNETYTEVTNFDIDLSFNTDHTLAYIKLSNPVKVLIDFKAIFVPSEETNLQATYLNIGYFNNEKVAFNSTDTDLKGYMNYKVINFAYPTTDIGIEFKVYVSYLNSDDIKEEYFHKIGGGK